MIKAPVALQPLIVRFVPLFSKHIWEYVQGLIVGAILAPGKCTKTAALRVMGLGQERHRQDAHWGYPRERGIFFACILGPFLRNIPAFTPTKEGCV